MMLDWQTLGSIGSCAQGFAGLVTLVSIIFFIIEIKELTKQTKLSTSSMVAGTYQEIVSTMMSIHRDFIEFPSLRPFFYDNLSVPDKKNSEDYQRIQAEAEKFLDFMEEVVVLERNASKSNEMNAVSLPLSTWFTYFRDVYNTSPIMRAYLSDHRKWYNKYLVQLLDKSLKTEDE